MRRFAALLCAALAMQPRSAASEPHAYSVAYRPLDHCAPPNCRIETRLLSGNVMTGAPAGYATIGSDKTELFARRAIALAGGGAMTFEVPRSDDAFEFEVNVGSADPRGGPFAALVEVVADGHAMLRRTIVGHTEPFELPRSEANFGQERRYFTRVREALPRTAGQSTTVSVRNEGTGSLIVASPLVYRRVAGRAARQAVLVIFDAVPYPLLMQTFTGGGWISDWVASRGLLFPHAMSPGQLTGSFVRRFFKADYFRLDGDPSLLGQGFFETPPEVSEGPVARLAEQGFTTIALGSNLYLTPVLGRIGFDVNYNLESTLDLPKDPPIVARRFDAEMQAHADDDALFVVWFGSTHIPWREGKPATPEIQKFEIPKTDLESSVLAPIGKNLADAIDSFRKVKTSADLRAPTADRIWIIGADHGHTFTVESRGRPWRLTGEAVDRNHMHCCLSSQQEVRTPLLVLTDGGPPERGTIDRPISTLVAWRAIEKRFGVDLGLPKTSAFALPGERAFDDGVIVSVGNSGSLAARRGDLSYRSYEPAMHLAPAWSVSPEIALLLAGTPARAGDIASEELYDLKADPGEKNNLAADRFADLLAMRERVAHWLAEYADTPDRPRYRYGLRFGGSVTIGFDAPRAFAIAVDGGTKQTVDRVATLTGTRFEFEDGGSPLGVIDISGRSFVARCASSGLPVAVVDPTEPRLNLALARTNCPTDERAAAAAPGPGEAIFNATLVSSRVAQATAAGRLPELQNALRRWGYVRDK
jgi:hypothetical protein